MFGSPSFKRELFNNSIFLYKTIYILHFYEEKYMKFIKNQGFGGRSIYKKSFITLFSFGDGGIRGSHVEIKFGKNFKVKHIHVHYI